MRDGHLNKCKDCTRGDVKKHRSENIDKIREYDRSRGNRQSPGYLKQWRARYPKKYKAHSKVNWALKSGKLKRKNNCDECGVSPTVAHHDDYSKPLSVRWLCQGCHKRWHSKNGEGINAI